MTIPAMAQKQLFTGVVKDALGEPVIGASVVEKGSSNGSVTDLDGKFSVSTIPGTTLVVSYVGYKSQEVKAKENMNITLQEDAQVLDNVVVIGYGVQKKSVVTASIAKVSSDDLEGKTRLRADDALKGMAAGVNVTSASGQPGSKSMIRVRGIGTINNSEPLYIIDGMPTDQDGMESVNPADIESIEEGCCLWCYLRCESCQWCNPRDYQERKGWQGFYQLQLLLRMAERMEEA